MRPAGDPGRAVVRQILGRGATVLAVDGDGDKLETVLSSIDAGSQRA